MACQAACVAVRGADHTSMTDDADGSMVSTFPATEHDALGTHPIVKDTFAVEFSVGSDSRADPVRRRGGAHPLVGRVGVSARGVGEIEVSAWVCIAAG